MEKENITKEMIRFIDIMDFTLNRGTHTLECQLYHQLINALGCQMYDRLVYDQETNKFVCKFGKD